MLYNQEFVYSFDLYNVAMVTPHKIRIAPMKISQESAPEKYRGNSRDKIIEKVTPQNEYVTLRQRALAAPILSMALYQHKNEYMPIAAVTVKSIQQGADRNIAEIPSMAEPNPPAKIGATTNKYTSAEVVYLINNPNSGSTTPAFIP